MIHLHVLNEKHNIIVESLTIDCLLEAKNDMIHVLSLKY